MLPGRVWLWLSDRWLFRRICFDCRPFHFIDHYWSRLLLRGLIKQTEAPVESRVENYPPMIGSHEYNVTHTKTTLGLQAWFLYVLDLFSGLEGMASVMDF
jgi:hypothetical protein